MLHDKLRGGGTSDDNERASTSKGSSRWKEMLGLRKALCVGGGNGPAKKAGSSDKGIADADMVTADMAASNQVGISCMRPQLSLIFGRHLVSSQICLLHAAGAMMMR